MQAIMPMTIAWRVCAAALAAAAIISAAPYRAPAQDIAANYPNRAIRIIVGFTAGGGNDLLARLVGQKLSEAWGQPVVIENKPGAGAIIGTEYVKNQPADGYTLLMGASGAMTVNPAVYSKLPYDTQRDFAPISMVAVFKQRTRAPLEHIPYKGSNETLTAVISGQVLLSIVDAAPAAGQIAAGQVRALAVTSGKRSPQFPDVPTLIEAGVPDVDVAFWSGLFAPAGTPPAIVKKLQDEVRRIVKLPEIQERMRQLAVEPVGNTADEFAKAIAADIARWTEVATASGIKIEP